LRPAAAVAVLVLATVACAAPAPPSTPAIGPTETARFVANDGSVVVVNVVVAAGTHRGRLPRLAGEIRARHPRSRVIVTFFAASAGPERYVIGHVPNGDEPLVHGPRAPSWLATYDFPAKAGR
jgi:hypothetical protein